MKRLFPLIPLVLAFSVFACTGVGRTASAPEFKLQEYLGEDWSGERVGFKVNLPDGMDPDHLMVKGSDGRSLPAQFLADQPGGREGRVYFITDLPAKAGRTWTLVNGRSDSGTDLYISNSDGFVEFGTSRIAVRCPIGQKTWEEGVGIDQVGAPIRSVKLSDGTWTGSGAISSSLKMIGFTGEVVSSGPVFDRIRLSYRFEKNKEYAVEMEALAGQPVVLVTEKYNLNKNNGYLEGIRPSNAPSSGNHTMMAYNKRMYTKGNYWTLSFDKGFNPDRLVLEQGNGLWERSEEGGPPSTFKLDKEPGPIVTLNPTHGEWWMNCGQWAGAYDSKGKGLLAMMALRAGSWTDPHQNVPVMENGDNGVLRGIMPINNGGRTWGLFSDDREAVVKDRGPEPDWANRPGIDHPGPVQLATIKYGLLPLDVVKDWPLGSEGTAVTAYPHIFANAQELPAIRKHIAGNPEMNSLIARLKDQWEGYRKQKDPNYPLYRDRIMNPMGLDNLYLATGDESYAQDLATLLIDRMGYYIHQTRAGVGISGYHLSHGYGMFHLTTGDLPLFTREADIVLGSTSVSPGRKAEIRAMLAFFGELFADLDYFSPNYNNGNTDMVTSYNEALGKLACVLSGYPKAEEWALKSAKGLTEALDKGWYIPSTEQDEWYAMLTLEMVTQTAVSLKRAGLYDLFKDQRYRDGLDYFGKLLVPPDPRYGGGYVVPFGNGQAEWLRSAIWAVAASAVKDEDPEFASRLMWYWERSGKLGTFRYGDMEPGGWASLGWVDPEIPAVNPQFKSEVLTDWGVLFRDNAGTDKETFMALQLGKRSGLNQYFNAEGGMVLHAYGMPLVLNSGLRSYDARIHDGYANLTSQRWLANRPSFDYRNEQESVPRTGKLLEWSAGSRVDMASGEWSFRRLVAYPNPGPTTGKDAFELSKPRPQVPGLTPGFTDVETLPTMITWRRHVMFIKDTAGTGADYFVIRDSAQTPVPWDWSISSLAGDLRIDGNSGSFTGKFGVDLELVPLTPVPELVTGTWGPSESFAGDWRQKLYQVQLPTSGEMAAVLFPHPHGVSAPVITPWAGGLGARIQFKDAVHYVLLADQPQRIDADGITVEGRSAVVMSKAGTTTLSLVSGSRIKAEGIELTDADAVTSKSVTIDADRSHGTVSGESHGEARAITLHLPYSLGTGVFTLDGKPAVMENTGSGDIRFNVPKGDHTFRIE